MDIILIIIFILSLITNVVLFVYIKRSSLDNPIKILTGKGEDDSLELIKLKENIDLLNAKNNALSFKVDELNLVINELNSQKHYLADNIDKLEKLAREKEEICAIAAHDIKNPAGTIKNLVSLLDEYDLTIGEQKQIHESLINISSRIIILVDEFANTVKSDVAQLTMNFVKKNFGSLVEIVANRYLGISKRKSIEIIKHDSANQLEVELDSDRIEEVIENLVSNALKFSPKGSKIELKYYKDENNLVFETIDNGLGLSEEELQQAFLRGTTLSSKPTGGESSTGLGLWIVKRIINKHKGLVWVKSKKGSGSTFGFKIPLKQDFMQN